MLLIYLLIPLLALFSNGSAQDSTKSVEPTLTKPVVPTPESQPVVPPLESLPPEFREIEEQERKNGGDAFTSGLLKMLATLGMMITLIYIISYMLRKAMNKSQLKINETSGIKILESRSLNQRTAIYLVEVRGKEYVIAESPHGATLLDRIQ